MDSLRYTRIDQIALLQKDTQNDDFAAHFYLSRHESLNGIPMFSAQDLQTASKKAIYDAVGKNQYELAQICSKDRGNAIAWSMNWYRLRTHDNKIFQLTDDDKAKIVSDFEDVSKTAPLITTIHIFQKDTSDMLLIAVSLVIDPEHLCLDD